MSARGQALANLRSLRHHLSGAQAELWEGEGPAASSVPLCCPCLLLLKEQCSERNMKPHRDCSPPPASFLLMVVLKGPETWPGKVDWLRTGTREKQAAYGTQSSFLTLPLPQRDHTVTAGKVSNLFSDFPGMGVGSCPGLCHSCNWKYSA